MSNTRIAEKPHTTVAEVDHERVRICLIKSVLKVLGALFTFIQVFSNSAAFFSPAMIPALLGF